MRVLFSLVIAIGLGCSDDRGAASPVERTETTISVGQPWSAATETARKAGYELHDASMLAMEPTPDGFYVDLPGGRGFIVYRDPQRDAVASMERVENWPGPKVTRVYHDADSFELPPPDPMAR